MYLVKEEKRELRTRGKKGRSEKRRRETSSQHQQAE